MDDWIRDGGREGSGGKGGRNKEHKGKKTEENWAFANGRGTKNRMEWIGKERAGKKELKYAMYKLCIINIIIIDSKHIIKKVFKRSRKWLFDWFCIQYSEVITLSNFGSNTPDTSSLFRKHLTELGSHGFFMTFNMSPLFRVHFLQPETLIPPQDDRPCCCAQTPAFRVGALYFSGT